jgi:hypothetical protein
MKGLIGKSSLGWVSANILLEMGTRSSLYGMVEVYEDVLIRT